VAGAPSEQTAETIFHERSLSLKKSPTSLFTSTALVVVVRGLQNKQIFLNHVVFNIAHEYNKLAYIGNVGGLVELEAEFC